MKKSLAITCYLVVLVATAHLVDADGSDMPCVLTIDDFRVLSSSAAEVKLLQDISQVLSVLGKANKSSLQPWGYMEYSYDGLLIAHPKERKQVFLIRVRSSDYRTPRGVAVGARKIDLFSRYNPLCFHESADGTFLVSQAIVTDGRIDADQDMSRFDDARSRVYSLSFKFEGDKISEIVINIALQD